MSNFSGLFKEKILQKASVKFGEVEILEKMQVKLTNLAKRIKKLIINSIFKLFFPIKALISFFLTSTKSINNLF